MGEIRGVAHAIMTHSAEWYRNRSMKYAEGKMRWRRGGRRLSVAERIVRLGDGAWTVWADGAAWPNPGPYSCAAILQDPEGRRYVEARYLGAHGTNNQAEYEGLILALRELKRRGATKAVIVSDSKLILGQFAWGWRVTKAHLAALLATAREESWGLKLEVHLVPRELNAQADAAAERALLPHQKISENIS